MEPGSDIEPVVDKIRRGEISVLDAFAAELPDVFAAEILPKLAAQDTLRLAQVNKLCRDTVWSEDNVRSLGAKFQETIPKIYDSTVSLTIFRFEYAYGHPIHWAAAYRVLPAVRALLKSEEEAYKRVNSSGLTALHYAVGNVRDIGDPSPSLAIARMLIEAGADINKLTNDGRTPLRLAAMGQVEATKILIDAGADLNISSPLSAIQSYVRAFPVAHQEFGREFYACAALLIKAGADDSESDFDDDDSSSLCSSDISDGSEPF